MNLFFYVLRRGWPYVLALAVFVGGAAWLWAAGGDHVRELKDAEIAQLQGQHMQDMKTLDDAHRLAFDAEQRRAAEQLASARADMVALDARMTKENSDAKARHEIDLASLRAGNVRVRERFTCPAGGSAGGAGSAAKAVSGPAGMGDAASSGGLRGEDVEFLLREAERADQAVRQLMACQAIVRNDRKGE